jgi:hypothetical protein
MDILEKITSTQFLGSEFLTWLWYQEDLNEGNFTLEGDLGVIELYFEDKLTMGSTAIDEQQDSFKGGKPTRSLEARTALKLGKMAISAKIRILQGEQEWQFNLKAEPLMMNGIKLPDILTKDPHSQFFERMFLLEHLDSIYRSLYKQFLQIRLSDQWMPKHLVEIQNWIAQRTS